MTATDERALLAAIAAQPDEDTPRLVYADWLDENGGHERAEFIRAQVELATWQIGCSEWCSANSLCRRCWRHLTLQHRDKALREKHEREWRKAGAGLRCEGTPPTFPSQRGDGKFSACAACNHTGDVGGLLRVFNYTHDHGDGTCHGEDEQVRLQFRRGFPDAVECRLADVVAEADVTCERCKGTGAGEPTFDVPGHKKCPACGHSGLQSRTDKYGRPDQWCEWCWVVHLGRHTGFENCPTCSGRCTVRQLAATPWARAVVRWHPVTAFRVTGFDSMKYNAYSGWYSAKDYPNGGRAGIVPHAVWLAIDGHDELIHKELKAYPSSEAANDALATALARFVRAAEYGTVTPPGA